MNSRIVPLLYLTVTATASGQIMPDTMRLADRAVTALKINSTAGVAPAATMVLYGDELRKRGMLFVTDALREVPGLTVVGNGSYGSLTSIFLRGGESDYVKVLLDGVPLNQPGGSINLADLSLDNIERVEVVRGPATVLHGADAVSGVVQLFTRKGTAQQTIDMTAMRGSFGNSLYEIRTADRPSQWSYSASGSQFGSDGTYPFNSDYRNRVGSLNIGHESTKGQKFSATARYGDARAHFPTDYTGIPVDSNQFTRARNFQLGIAASEPIKDHHLLFINAFESRQNSTAENRPDSPGDSTGFGFDSDRSAITSRRGVDARLDRLANTGSRFSIGAAYEREKEEQTSRTVSNFGSGTFEESDEFAADRSTRSLYSQLYAVAGPRITLQIGARLDDNSAFGTFTTWRAGAAFERVNGVRFWAAAGTSFKAPTFSELFAQSAFEVGNASLDPERSSSIEAGIAKVFLSGRGSLALTGFSQRFTDLIQFVSAAPGETNYLNLAAASSRGLEFSGNWRAGTRLDLRGSWNLLHTEVTDTGAASSPSFGQGEALLRRPASSGSIGARLHSAGGATLSGVINFIGKRDDVDFRGFPSVRTTLPAYHTFDLALDWPVRVRSERDSGLDLIFRGENLFDAEYEQVVAFPGRGRTLFFGGRLHR